VKSKTRIKLAVGPLTDDKDKGKLINDDHGMAELLNKYFASVFTVEDQGGRLPEIKKYIFSGEDNENAVSILTTVVYCQHL